jgi:hypothetical protein
MFRPIKYSWKDFSNRFGDYVGEFGLYDLNEITKECTYVKKKILGKYKVIFNHKPNKNTTYMLKLASQNANDKEMEVINYVKPLVKQYDYYNLIIRIQTNPWRFAPHFDAMDQIAYALHGEKRWLLWNVNFSSSIEALKFRDDINNLNYEQLEMYLNKKNIKYIKKILKPHESFYIKHGTWHYVENINKTRGCIMLNVHLKIISKKFDDEFKILWPIQHKRCVNNMYY